MIAPYKLGTGQSITSTEIDTNEEGHYSLLLAQAQYNPIVFNQNNYTTWGTMDQRETNHESFQYLYNHLTRTYSRESWGTNPLGDFHCTPSSLFLQDGRILTFTNTDHNAVITVKRSNSPYDISAYTEISTITSNSPAYLNATLIGSRIWGVYRGGFDKLYLTYSDDEGETWNSPQVILDFDDANDWAYPRYIYTDSGDFIFACNKRETQGTDQNDYTDFYVFRTSDGVNIRNFEDTVTTNVSSSGALDDTALSDYNLGNIGFVKSTLLLDSGELAMHIGESIYYTSSGSTLNKSLTNANYFQIGVDVTSNFLKIDDNNIYLCTRVRETNGGSAVLGLVYTNDFFDSTTVTEISTTTQTTTPTASSNFASTRQTVALGVERKVFGSGDLTDPFNSYSNLILVDRLNL